MSRLQVVFLVEHQSFSGWIPLWIPVVFGKKKPGPSKTTRTPENVERVKQAVLQSPKRSARKHASALRISDRTLRRILHQDLKFHPYKLAVVQKLNPRDFDSRQRTCEAIVENQPNNTVVFFSDEAHFHLSGCVSKQNMRYLSGVNPQELHEKPLHAERVTVWCALSRTAIIGPWFF